MIVSDISLERAFAPLQFQEIIGNCSLEHVHHIDLALQNIQKKCIIIAANKAVQGIVQIHAQTIFLIVRIFSFFHP